MSALKARPVIPATAHFIWLGSDLQWVHLLAMRSAAQRGGFERVVLHHNEDLTGCRWYSQLKSLERLEMRRVDPEKVVSACPTYGPELTALMKRLSQPAAITNLMRAAILYMEGGVYLDTDTVTLQELTDLRAESTFFCGQERITLPSKVVYTDSFLVWANAMIQNVVRELFYLLPQGWRWWRPFEGWLHLAANNAIMGSEPGHPLLEKMMSWMLNQPAERKTKRYSLGVHTLQDCLAEDPLGATVLPPPYFYPLGPVLSLHWFRRRRALPSLDQVLFPETRVVHWYASVRTRKLVPQIDPEYVRRHADHQLFSAMALPFLESL